MPQAPTPAPTVPRDELAVERWVAPFFADSGLWPVTAVVIAHGILGVAVLLLEVLRSPGPWSVAAFAGLALASLELLRRTLRRRRLGALGWTLLATWALGALVAWGADRLGLY